MFKTNFLGTTKFGGTNNLRGHCPRMPPVATGLPWPMRVLGAHQPPSSKVKWTNARSFYCYRFIYTVYANEVTKVVL